MIKKSDEINREIYTISEFAKMTGVSTDTLRYYDKINLFKPTSTDPQTGYRYYTLKEFEEIGVIQTLQTLGVSLKDIKHHLENKTFFSSYMLLSKQYADIDRKIAELIQLKSYLSEKLSTLEDVMNNNSDNEIVLKEIACSRSVFCRSVDMRSVSSTFRVFVSIHPMTILVLPINIHGQRIISCIPTVTFPSEEKTTANPCSKS